MDKPIDGHGRERSRGEYDSLGESSNIDLEYIREMLLEEDLENEACNFHDPASLEAAEKSFYDVIEQEFPDLPNFCLHDSLYRGGENPGEDLNHCFGCEIVGAGCIAANELVGTNWVFDQDEFESFLTQDPISLIESPLEAPLVLSSSFSPMVKSLADNLERKRTYQPAGEIDDLAVGRNKQSAANEADDSETPEMLEELLHCQAEDGKSSTSAPQQNGENKKSQRNRQRSQRPNTKTPGARKQDDGGEIVDLLSLLTQCARAVSIYDQRTAWEVLKKIRHHSSASGDGNQRLAHYFANGLEARLAAGTPLYKHLPASDRCLADIITAYMVFLTACPFKKTSNILCYEMIQKMAVTATRIHIIDFGILYGFQWPSLIQRLSNRPGGPPNLRITGIEFPQPGFRTAERVQATGRRLENCSRRFNVPFECNLIAQKWETVRLEDLKVDRANELVVVNCLDRLKNVQDETGISSSPRDNVLKLIREINPDLFIHGVINGTYNTPFFYSRFREALFHFAAWFDMFEATVPREGHQRLLFEKEVVGRDAMNVIACEGAERVERPETYKQWQVRHLEAGFRPLPLDQEILKKVKKMVKSNYHEDFVVDEDGPWMLQGWKGRILCAASSWVPV